ncbi:MAG TPA: carboxypeptidase regulatory-like domain-containing protein [Terriglobia bacterium]|nr:carboxypeptidase regulatory-like domain-containing protein [Terriglobia bacterium]
MSKKVNLSMAASSFGVSKRTPAYLVIACLLTVMPTAAQNRNGGEIRGTVTDTSGAAVSGVHIAIVDTLTNVVTHLVSDNHGVYDAPTLKPGTYSVAFGLQGFKTLVKRDIQLHVETITVDAELEVGSLNQQVNVIAGAQLVQTETSDKRSTLTQEAVVDLPTVGLNWYDFTALQPGTNPGSPTTTSFGGVAGGQGVGLNGNGGFLQSWQLDGGESSVAMNPDFLQAPIDSIGEINFKTNNFSAEYANGTAVFSVITKSGTNRFHGTLYEFNQNDLYDAANFFVNSVNQTKPTVRWNEYGGNLGGPIKKDKAFFFFNFQRNPVGNHATGFYNYPTAAMRAGDFTGLPTVYDPSTTTQLPDGTYTRTPFPNNQIPADRIDPAAKNILGYYPMPNVPGAGVVNNYFYDIFVPQTTTYYNGKVDFDLSPRNRINFSTMHVQLDNLTGYTGYSATPPIDTMNGSIHEWTLQLSDVWTITPSTVNEFRISWARENGVWSGAEQGKGWSQKLGIPNLTADFFPAISVEGTASPSNIGWSFKDAVDTSSKPIIADDITLVRGKHILKFGGEFDMYRGVNCWSCLWPGAFDFDGIFTANPANPNATGMGFADFLLGLPDNWSDSWTPTIGSRQHTIQAFAQDDFKLTPRLTLNIGLRWFAPSGWGEEHNRWGDFDPTLTNPATGTPGAVIYGGQGGRSALQEKKWDGFGPRLGFAWAPRANWSVRGGYAIIDTSVGLSGNGAGLGLGISVNGYQAATDNLTPFMQLSQGHAPPAIPTFPPSASFYNGGGISYLPYDFPLNYVQQWTFNVQHQFSGGTLLEVGYTGTRDNHIPETSDLNQVPAAAIAKYGAIGVNMQPYRPYPQFQGISYQAYSGRSSYNSLQVTFKKSLSHGLWITSNYTWSHALDTGTLEGYYGSSLLQISDNTSANYGNADVDVRHIWNGGFTYELPFGTGRSFLNRGGLLNGVVGGWRVSSLWVANTGQPFNVYWGGPNLDFSLSNSWLPNRVCNGALAHQTVNEWFNPACFVQAAPGTYGNAGRNILWGPSFVNMNSSLAKTFSLPFLGEQGKIDFRLDVSDLLNHPNFGAVNGYITPPPTAAGSITSALTNRTAQIGARLTF